MNVDPGFYRVELEPMHSDPCCDEAITTPTEESVRRAVAIQMIINKELGLNYG